MNALTLEKNRTWCKLFFTRKLRKFTWKFLLHPYVSQMQFQTTLNVNLFMKKYLDRY